MGIYFDSVLINLAFATIIFISTIYVFFKYMFTYWSRNNIAQLNPSFPFGDTTDIFLKTESLGTLYALFYNKFKSQKVSYGGYYFLYRPELMLLDLDIIKQVLVKEFHRFSDRGSFADEKNDPISGHLFNLRGQKWKNLRAKLTPTFTSGKMKMMFNTLLATSDELNNILNNTSQKSDPLDIRDILARFTSDVIGSVAFGLDCNCLQNPQTEFRKYGSQAFEPASFIDRLRAIGSALFPDFYKFFKIKAINQDVSNFFLNVVKNTVKFREDNNIYRKDFMQLLIQLKNRDPDLSDDESTMINNENKGNKGITVEEMAAQCFVFFVAGFETSSTTMTFCLYELVKNPEIQENLRDEVIRVLKKYDNKLCYDAIMEMHYMEKCINVLGIHRDPDVYPDPEKYDPERFSESEKAKRHPMAFIPFGEGPRICIGLRFGMMQTKVGLSVLLKNYKFTLNNKTPEPIVMDPNNFILSSKGGIWLDAHKVNS